MVIRSHDVPAAVPTLPSLDLPPELKQRAEKNSKDSNSRSSSASSWVRRLPTVAAATLIGLAATADLTLAKEGEVSVGLSDGGRFADAQKWNNYFCVSSERCAVGDVNGDGRADVIAFQHRKRAESGVYVSLSELWLIDARTGKPRFRFGAPQKWNKSFPFFCTEDDNGLSGDLYRAYPEECAVGDVNGDGKADIIAFQHGITGTGVYVGISDGTQFAAPQKWNDYFCVNDERCAVGDVNGDGRADVIAFQHRNPGTDRTGVYVGLSEVWLTDAKTGTRRFRFAAPQKWNGAMVKFGG
jgi:FG-GAP-like repeat